MRLLNDKEIEVAIKCDLEMLGFASIENIKEATKAQDAKTLKAVGKWLDENSFDDPQNAGFYNSPRHHRIIGCETWKQLRESLLKGEKPN